MSRWIRIIHDRQPRFGLLDGGIGHHKGDNVPGLSLFWLTTRTLKLGRISSASGSVCVGRISTHPQINVSKHFRIAHDQERKLRPFLQLNDNVGEHPR